MDPFSATYRKVTTKTYVGPYFFELEKTISKNCADVLIASVSNRAEALVLNDICIDLGIKLIIAGRMLEGHISVMRPFNLPCFRCSCADDIPERQAESCTAFRRSNI